MHDKAVPARSGSPSRAIHPVNKLDDDFLVSDEPVPSLIPKAKVVPNVVPAWRVALKVILPSSQDRSDGDRNKKLGLSDARRAMVTSGALGRINSEDNDNRALQQLVGQQGSARSNRRPPRARPATASVHRRTGSHAQPLMSAPSPLPSYRSAGLDSARGGITASPLRLPSTARTDASRLTVEEQEAQALMQRANDWMTPRSARSFTSGGVTSEARRRLTVSPDGTRRHGPGTRHPGPIDLKVVAELRRSETGMSGAMMNSVRSARATKKVNKYGAVKKKAPRPKSAASARGDTTSRSGGGGEGGAFSRSISFRGKHAGAPFGVADRHEDLVSWDATVMRKGVVGWVAMPAWTMAAIDCKVKVEDLSGTPLSNVLCSRKDLLWEGAEKIVEHVKQPKSTSGQNPATTPSKNGGSARRLSKSASAASVASAPVRHSGSGTGSCSQLASKTASGSITRGFSRPSTAGSKGRVNPRSAGGRGSEAAKSATPKPARKSSRVASTMFAKMAAARVRTKTAVAVETNHLLQELDEMGLRVRDQADPDQDRWEVRDHRECAMP